MFWAMVCWETLGPAIHVDDTLIRSTYLSIVTDLVHPFMETVFPDCSVMVQEWFEEHNNHFEVLPWLPKSPDLNPI